MAAGTRRDSSRRGDAAVAKEAGKAAAKEAAKAAAVAERYPPVAVAELPPDLRERVEAIQQKTGFVPAVFLKLARRPDECRAFFAYHDALMLKDGPLTKADREMIVVATSALNRCLYCVVAHGAILRIYRKDAVVADQVAINHRKAAITPRERAMLDFACRVAGDSALIDEADFAALHAHGFDDEAIWDIAAIAAFFGLSNRMANVTGMMPNPEFHALGRAPR